MNNQIILNNLITKSCMFGREQDNNAFKLQMKIKHSKQQCNHKHFPPDELVNCISPIKIEEL